jgi:anti-sigma B factor antagonist
MTGSGSNAYSSGFDIATSVAEDGWQLAVSGELDLLTSPRLEEALGAVIEGERPARVVVDLKAVSFFDSSALNVLLNMQREASAHDVQLAVVASRPVERVLTLTGVDKHLTWSPAAG